LSKPWYLLEQNASSWTWVEGKNPEVDGLHPTSVTSCGSQLVFAFDPSAPRYCRRPLKSDLAVTVDSWSSGPVVAPLPYSDKVSWFWGRAPNHAIGFNGEQSKLLSFPRHRAI